MATPDDVLRIVGERFGFARYELTGPRRHAHIFRARAVAMGLLYGCLGLSLPEIGRLFHRDHTTVLNAVRRFKTWFAERDRDILELVAKLGADDHKPMDQNKAADHVRKLFPRGGVRLGEEFQIELRDGSEAYARRCWVGVEDAGGIRELADGLDWDECIAQLRQVQKR